MRNGTILVGAAMCASSYLLIGCLGELVAIVPSAQDQGVTSDVDMAQAQEMGDGKVHFFPDIQNDLDKYGCTAGGACHGNTQTPILKAGPTAQADKDANYTNFTSKCITATPAMSPIIMNALGQQSHGGGAIMKMADPQYQRWIDWITAGEAK